MLTIDDIAADVAQLRRENADLRARIQTLHTSAAHRGWRRSLPAILTSVIAITGLLALTGSRATIRAGSGPSVVVAPFNVVDAAGSPVMTVNRDGRMVLWYHNKVFVRLDHSTSGGGSLQALDSTNQGGALLEANAAGSLLQMEDASGRRRVALGFTPAGKVQFSILNGAGNTVTQLDEDTEGGHLVLANPDGIARVEAGSIQGVGALITYGPKGSGLLKGH